MKIFLDDQGRDIRESWVPQDWRRAVNFKEFKELVEESYRTGDNIEAISFDNDLGEETGELTEGVEIMKWVSENYPELLKPAVEISIHSQNNVARELMLGKLKFWREHIEELIAAKERPDPWDEIKVK